ncbi:MAG: hypothetical protein KF758_01315 [Anaerolineales bacterium]|nr:hypothetical protein [Anaerolineales bacterium]
MSDTELRKIFDFNPSDLIANQMGRLSDKQAERIKKAEQGANNIFRGVGIFLILIGILISFFLLRAATQAGWELTSSNTIGPLVALGFIWLILGLFAFGGFKLASTKRDMSVQKVEGKVRLVKVEKQQSYKTASGSTSQRTVQQYELRVGKVKFEDVDEELLNVIEEGDNYIFYYSPYNKEILSCEFISKGK